MGIDNKVKAINMRLVFSVLIIISFVLIISLNLVSAAVGDVYFCAEKTKSGAWCMNVPANQIDTSINPITHQPYRQSPTSCESTDFCRRGTCVNGLQGECRPNVPQRVCQQSSGVWRAEKPDAIPQCQLGCCLLGGDQAAFVTQTKCKALSSDYGVEIEFRSDIKNEAVCIESANPKAMGACVIDDGFVKDCKLLSKSDCKKLESRSENTEGTTVDFKEGLLCSAESLATRCGPTSSNPKTTCVSDKDEVYFLDTCGNLANIYDASKINDKEYWTNIKERDESCNPNENNAGSATCGSCNYLSGSTCKAVKRGDAATPQPKYGNFVCADLSCKYQGKTYQHGETWCGGTSGLDQSLPGSEYARFVCYSGEVTVEQCSTLRSEICVEGAIPTEQGDYKTALCTINLWQEPGGCLSQDNQRDCENTDKRYCKWVVGQSLKKDDSGNPLVIDEEGKLVQKEEDDKRQGATCLPKYPPGFEFWNPESEAEAICAIASDNCIVKFEKGLLGSYECKENCECVGLKKGDEMSAATEKGAENSQWAKERNNMCMALGDCGIKKNYIGAPGYHDENIVEIKPVEKP